MPWPFRSRLKKAEEAYRLKLFQARTRLLESTTAYWDRYVDPREAFLDDDGSEMLPLGVAADPSFQKTKIRTMADLTAIRKRCRELAEENEFAINGHENRISYVVGTGLKYQLEVDEDHPVPDDVVKLGQEFLERMLDESDWVEREQEAVRRGDRDGEVFIRTFWPPVAAPEAMLPTFRFVEPEQVYTPSQFLGQKGESWGVKTEPDDVETVLGYYVDEELVPPSELHHIKLNVDRSTKRGCPTFYPVRKNLTRAEKLLRNMSAVATLQAAIALIREHEGFSSDQVETFRDDQDDFTLTNQTTAKTSHFKQFGPGSIIDAPAGTKYQFPVAGVAAEKFVIVLQAELRAIASRLVMPEFMLTSDASNANYSSTMIAEGPAVKMFQRLQSFWRNGFTTVIWRAIENAVRAGLLDEQVLLLNLTATLPSLTVRDEEKEGKTLGREHDAGVLSKQTWAEIRGYDFEKEQARLDQEREKAMEHMPVFSPATPLAPDESGATGDEGSSNAGGE